MNDLNRYLLEAMRVRRTIQVYSEFFDSTTSIEVLTEKSLEFTGILQRSMHDEILMSLARMFDSDGYRSKGTTIEYLSQRNLAELNREFLSNDLNLLRQKTSDLWEKVKVKNYRDHRLAHNGKDAMLITMENVKHNVTFADAVDLVETSIQLILGIMCAKNETSIAANLNDKYIGIGTKFIETIKRQ